MECYKQMNSDLHFPRWGLFTCQLWDCSTLHILLYGGYKVWHHKHMHIHGHHECTGSNDYWNPKIYTATCIQKTTTSIRVGELHFIGGNFHTKPKVNYLSSARHIYLNMNYNLTCKVVAWGTRYNATLLLSFLLIVKIWPTIQELHVNEKWKKIDSKKRIFPFFPFNYVESKIEPFIIISRYICL